MPAELEVVGELAALLAENNQGPKSRGAVVAGIEDLIQLPASLPFENSGVKDF